MSLAPPPPVPTGVATRLLADLRAERAAQRRIPFPPGETLPSLRRTRRFNYEPLPVLLEAYERYGPIFTLRVFHAQIVFMLGPEANHFMLVSHADHFTWREGHLGDLIPLLGDGLLTTDGPFHDGARRIMLPAFGRERVAATLDTMLPEIDRALHGWHDGAALDLYAWTRNLALRIAMRALFGLDPDGPRARDAKAAAQFEDALGFWANDYFLQVLRGPRTPWTRMLQARRRLDAIVHDEIARRRRTGERGEDILSMLLDAADDEGRRLDDDHVRDQVMTLLFAGHDTTTSTIAFLFHELARHPAERDRLLAERDAVLGRRDPTFAELMGGVLPRLDRVLDETLRLFPAAWIGPRRSARPFRFAGHAVPAGVPVNYSSWASHRLPDVWGDPEAFRPDRFAAPHRAQIPKGAYVPFGGGSRTCLGMRFGQLEIKTIVSRILRDFTLDLESGFALRVRQMPTISPRDGLPMRVRARTGPR
ncbi:cytochrome P450 [Capillimicrobium parvum]|uniref:Cytochrome P450 139 n=1 Tax=Capillimicrobium parvum TaxID=2884022 RepID=A0A9E6XTW1_9ACTN|nr:cytochrome P450 [Capillimicrobium parvum]UGS34028.1 Putative cytochrome P450 139 [Capillimicrobium parvum]